MRIKVVLLLCVVLFVGGCASTEILNVSKDETANPEKLNKVLVIGVIKAEAYRKIFEQKMVLELQRNGIEAISLYSIFGDRLEFEKDEAHAAMQEQGVDGVLLMQLVDSEKKQVYTAGMTVVTSTGYGGGWYGYYGSGYQTYRTPGRTYNFKEVTAETIIFSLKEDKPVWSALTRTTEEKTFELIESYIKGIHTPLVESGLF